MALRVRDKYFEWLVGIVAQDRFNSAISYKKLFTQLHETPFLYSILLDRNRAFDGKDLRYRFASLFGCRESSLDGLPCICSVFEMMVALSLRCEENIMDDPRYGNRTGQWFWSMISSLGLNGLYDSNYDEQYVTDVINRFMDRRYDADGTGGLFTVKNCDIDMRDLEIWDQLMQYLDTMTLYDI